MSSSSSSSAPLGPKKKPSCDCDCCEDQVIPTACAPETPKSVVLKTGQFTFNLPLLSVAGIGIANWSFGLDYLSENEVDGLLGKEFNYPQYDHLVELPGGDIDLITGHNTIERFIKVGDTYSSVDNNTSAVLTKSGTGEEEVFHLTGSSGSVVTFFGFDELVETPGQLKRKADHYGNTLNYQWSVSGDVNVLDKVIDGYGREVSYRYCTPPSSSSSSSGTGSLRLCEIEDFLGRKLSFQYDVHGRLVAVVTPAILRAAEGNEFPGGTAYVFRYRSAISSSVRHPDRMIQMTW